MDDATKLKEYEILSEDRRKAVDLFLKGVVISTAILAFGLKYLLETKDYLFSLSLGACGVSFLFLCHYSVYLCRCHVTRLHQRLNDLGAQLGMASVISARYIFNIIWVTLSILSAAWLGAFLITIVNLWSVGDRINIGAH